MAVSKEVTFPGINLVALTDIGPTLKALRKSRGQSLDIASALLGVTRQALIRYEKGRGIDVERLQKYEAAYGVQFMLALAVQPDDQKRLNSLKQKL